MTRINRYNWLVKKADEMVEMDNLRWEVAINVATVLLLHQLIRTNDIGEDE